MSVNGTGVQVRIHSTRAHDTNATGGQIYCCWSQMIRAFYDQIKPFQSNCLAYFSTVRWKCDKCSFQLKQLYIFSENIWKYSVGCMLNIVQHTLPVLWKTPGLQWQYLWAKASIILSIFCASPGKRKLHRNCLQRHRLWFRWSQQEPIQELRQSCCLTAYP